MDRLSRDGKWNLAFVALLAFLIVGQLAAGGPWQVILAILVGSVVLGVGLGRLAVWNMRRMDAARFAPPVEPAATPRRALTVGAARGEAA